MFIRACGLLFTRECVVDALDRLADSTAFASLLRRCTEEKALALGKRVHARMIEAGFQEDGFLANLTIQMYGRCGDLQLAKSVFETTERRNIFTWNALIAAYAQNGHCSQAFSVFRNMDLEGLRASASTFIALLSACCTEGRVAQGKLIHERVTACGFDKSVAVQNTLINLYGKCGCLEDARRVFEGMPEKDIVSWNAMISVYAQKGWSKEALEVFNRIQLKPSHVTFVNVLRACSSLGVLSEGKSVHTQIVEDGLESNVVVCNSLINMYSKCGDLAEARAVFERMTNKNVITWNSIIGALVQHGQAESALEVYKKMDVEPNQVTFLSVLSACSEALALDEGKQVYAAISRTGLQHNDVVCSSLVNMYGKCGSVNDARKVFDQLHPKGSVSWTAMVSVYAQNGHNREALALFHEMEMEGVKMELASFVAVLSACSCLRTGISVHCRIEETGFETDILVGTALLNMYGKHGKVVEASRVFDKMTRKDVFAWTTMMKIYAEQGAETEAAVMFQRMELEGMRPSEVTFVGILEACSELSTVSSIHAQISETGLERRVNVSTSLVYAYSKCGSLETARSVFESSAEKDIVSWNAIIGAYSRHKLGKEAFHLFRRMDLEGVAPNDVTFIAVLDACSSLNELAQVQLVHECIVHCGLEPTVTVANALINVYSKCGRYDHGRRVFDEMNRRDMVSWSSVIAAYAQHGQYTEAFRLLEEMQLDGTEPGDAIFLIVLFSASHTGQIETSLRYFRLMVSDWQCAARQEHYACMVDALARTGWLAFAEELIRCMPFKAGGVQWTTLLGWCRVHSDSETGARAAEEVFQLDPGKSSPYALLSGTFSSSTYPCRKWRIEMIQK